MGFGIDAEVSEEKDQNTEKQGKICHDGANRQHLVIRDQLKKHSGQR